MRPIPTFLILGTLALAGCDGGQETVVDAPEKVRPIKSYEISELAGSSRLSYSGTLVAADTSSLSFPISGTVATVLVEQGDSVAQGQVIAELDPEPFELDVSAAQAEMDRAEADFAAKRTEINRQQELFNKGWIAQAALDQATAGFEGAQAQLDYARSRRALAQRNLENTVLVAPFDGTIAERSVEPFQEISGGQSIVLMNSAGALEVEIAVSDTMVQRLSRGLTVDITVPNIERCGCKARITEIATTSGTGNTVAVTAALLDGPDALIPGMAAEATISLAVAADRRGFLVPLSAIVPGDDVANGYVFVFDSQQGVVRRVPVEGAGAALGNLIAVRGDLEVGNIIAAAGTSFLRDGQRVTLLAE
ncbi:MAG: efflux RND transporter periplasmic adaptor subunit [Alphaproteobacteria bacterium]|nr:efflux RND transporter periplasmic adaptor subunit [Alphaproteobacteria bacterium]